MLAGFAGRRAGPIPAICVRLERKRVCSVDPSLTVLLGEQVDEPVPAPLGVQPSLDGSFAEVVDADERASAPRVFERKHVWQSDR